MDVRETVHGPILNDVDERLAGRAADGPALDGRSRPTTTRSRRCSRLATVADFDGVPRGAVAVRRAGPELRLRRRRRPHRLPVPGLHADPLRPGRHRATDPCRAPTAATNGPAAIPFDDLPWQLDPGARLDRHGEQRPGGRELPVLPRHGVGPGRPGAADHRPAQRLRPGRRSPSTELGAIQMDTRAAAGPRRRVHARRPDRPGRRRRGPGDGRRRAHPRPDRRVGRRLRPRQPRAARPTWPGSTACSATSSTTSSARWPATTSAADVVGRPRRPPRRPERRLVGRRRPRRTSSRRGPMIVARAMDEAGAELRAAVGAPDGWTWGRLHTGRASRRRRSASSGIGPLEWYFDKGPFPVAGRRRRARRDVVGRRGRRTRIPTTRPTCRSASTASSTMTSTAQLPAADRHVRPRRRAASSSRPASPATRATPLRRHDRDVADRRRRCRSPSRPRRSRRPRCRR